MSGSERPRVLRIDRSHPFDPVSFFNDHVFRFVPSPPKKKKDGSEEEREIPPGVGFGIWRGPANAKGLSGVEEQDERSLRIEELDFSRIALRACESKQGVTREMWVRQLKGEGLILPDAKILEAIFTNLDLIPVEWQERAKGQTRFIFFEGTAIRTRDGNRGPMFIYFSQPWHENAWHCNCGSFDDDCLNNPSVVILP